MSGWIKLHRSILDWEWYLDYKSLTVFIFCLLKANSTPKKWMGVELNTGEFITSLNQISAQTGLSIKEVRNRLNKLEKTGEISKQKGTQWTKIKVCKFDSYQINEDKKGTERANEGQTKGKRRATTKNKENNKKERIDIPSLTEFGTYACQKIRETQNKNPEPYKPAIKLKYDAWVENGWKDGNDKPIKNWKVKILNTIPHLEVLEVGAGKIDYRKYLQ